ncbi:MAG: C4-dicarboxylate ABC transporter [Rhodospirillales bacterium]|nr:C4-dicarboxylate ABC transporter [Rhodospirillales bacterium]
MQKIFIGIIIGTVIGILLGASVVAPRLTQQAETKSKSNAEIATNEALPPVETETLSSKPVIAEQAVTPRSDYTGGRIQWKMASAFESSLPLFGSLPKRLESEIAILSGGDILIEFHEPGTLAPVEELFQAVHSGAIDAAFTTPFMDIKHNNSLGLFGAIPFGPGPAELLAWFYSGGGLQKFEAIYHGLGMHAQACGLVPEEPAGWFHQEISSPADFNGLRMRIEGFAARTVEKLGTKPVQMNANETFIALSNGDINAAEFSLPSLDYNIQLHKAAQHYYFPGWHQRATLLTLLVNLDTWLSLDDQQRLQIRTICGDNIRQGLAEGEAVQFDALKAFSSHGTEIKHLPPDVLDALNDAWNEVVLEESAQNKEFRRIWKSLSLFRRNYEIWTELNDM